MSQSGLLTEDEIKNYINEKFDLKLDREAFLKPTEELVCDIYVRFLDDTQLQWRKSKHSSQYNDEANSMASIVGWIRFLFEPYNIGFTFNFTDLIMPTRKRTTAFMNVLIFIRAQFDDCKAQLQPWKEEWSLDQEKLQIINKEINQKRLELDEVALRVGSMKPVDELRAEMAKKKAEFDAQQKKCELLGEEGAVIKNKIKALEENNQKKSAEHKSLAREVEENEKILNSLNGGKEANRKITELKQANQSDTDLVKTTKENCSKSKKKIDDTMRLLGSWDININDLNRVFDATKDLFKQNKNRKDTMDTKIEQANKKKHDLEMEISKLQDELDKLEHDKSKIGLHSRTRKNLILTDIERKRAANKEFALETANELETLKIQLEEVKEERAKIIRIKKECSQKFDTEIEKADRHLKALQDRFDESKQLTRRGNEMLTEYKTRLETLIGKTIEAEVPANRTYIKEPAIFAS